MPRHPWSWMTRTSSRTSLSRRTMRRRRRGRAIEAVARPRRKPWPRSSCCASSWPGRWKSFWPAVGASTSSSPAWPTGEGRAQGPGGATGRSASRQALPWGQLCHHLGQLVQAVDGGRGRQAAGPGTALVVAPARVPAPRLGALDIVLHVVADMDGGGGVGVGALQGGQKQVRRGLGRLQLFGGQGKVKIGGQGQAANVGVAVGDGPDDVVAAEPLQGFPDRKSTRLNSSHVAISYAVFCLNKTSTPLEHDPSTAERSS